MNKQRVAVEAYAIIATLAIESDNFNHPEVTRVLNYFNSVASDEEGIEKKGALPFLLGPDEENN